MKMRVVSLIGLGLLAAPLAAQQDGVQNRVASSLDTKLVDPTCKLDGSGDFRVRSSRVYISEALKNSVAENRARMFNDGVRVNTEAITTGGQAKNPAAWYYLGRSYLHLGDVVGADSAFTRAEALAPACKADIRKFRYQGFAALVNGGIALRQQKQEDSALVLYRAANVLLRDTPVSYSSIADIFASRGAADSAAAYFGIAATMEPTEPTQIKVRNQALFNYAVTLLNNQHQQEAIAPLHRYLGLVPDDVAAQKALAQAFRGAGMADSAAVIEAQLVAAVGTGDGSGDDAVSEDDLFDIGVKQFNDKKYADAAATFTRVISLNPTNRDALFNLANAYLALEDGPNLITTAQTLIALEPLSERDRAFLAQGYQFTKNQDKVLEAFFAREALLVNLDVDHFKLTADGATLTGTLTGRDAKDDAQKPLAPKPLVVSVDFLDKAGNKVGSTDVEIPALPAGQTQPFMAQGKGSGIKGWRYQVK